MRDLRTWDELQPLVGVGTEAADLDFKETLNPKGDDFFVEIGKDIAALANTLGGHIVVGASTELNRTRCKGFHGLSRDLGAELAGHFESAAKNRCRPTPFISTLLVDVPNHPKAHVVLVVRVEASAIAPVGASVKQPKGGALVDEAWVFPYRVGSQTEYLTPDQFGAFESMTARRAAALLDAIPLDQREAVDLCWTVLDINDDAVSLSPEAAPVTTMRVTLVAVLPRQNVARFHLADPAAELHLPLDEIATAWMEYPGEWKVALRGILRVDVENTRRWAYQPSTLAPIHP